MMNTRLDATRPATDVSAVLTDGYTVLPGYLPAPWCESLIAGLDELAASRPADKRLMPHEPFLELLGTDQLLDLVRPVLGEGLLFHHANGKRIDDGAGKPWHHDYDCDVPWDGRPESAMLHVMIYPAGLSLEQGALVLRPASHTRPVPRHHPNDLGYAVEPSDIVVTGGPGLVAVVNSATWHMRPPSVASGPRYYLNFSFIGPAPVSRPERDSYRRLYSTMPSLAGPDRRALLGALCRPSAG